MRITEGTSAVKLPGGCELEEPRVPENLRKINTKQINIIPFERYRFDTKEEEPEHEPVSYVEAIVPALLTLLMLAPLLFKLIIR